MLIEVNLKLHFCRNPELLNVKGKSESTSLEYLLRHDWISKIHIDLKFV